MTQQWKTVPVEQLLRWKSSVNDLAVLGSKADRYSVALPLKQEIADAIAAPQPSEPVAWMYYDSDGDVIFGHPNGYRPDDAVPVFTHAPDDTALLRQALEALTVLGMNYAIGAQHWPRANNAIAALRERLGETTPHNPKTQTPEATQ